MKFEPIAIIGRGCLLPGCPDPEALWQTINNNQVQISGPPEESWRIDMSRILETYEGHFRPDKSWSDRGGYISDFQKYFDPDCSQLDAALLSQLDPLVQWSVFAGKQALDCAKILPEERSKTGVILGNLSYPSTGHSRFTESVLLNKHLGTYHSNSIKSHYLNRFNSGLPAILLARALGLGAGAFSLDAACASGLFAIKLACDRLQARSADLMLAGAVNAADPLFIHVGFSALNAMSISGQSRPFHRDADGLVPAEGAAFVLLKRLQDAISSGDKIIGVIRGIGLSNDGRTGGFLSPSVEGQVRCMKQAYECADISPSNISYVECHATGTPTGDAAEVQSMSNVFKHHMPIGSLKANLGHLITTSGVAGLLKVLGGMEHGLLPRTPGTNPVCEALSNSLFHINEDHESWQGKPQIAGVSSFGFGGNNAHLIVSRFDERERSAVFASSLPRKKEIAVVAMEVLTHLTNDTDSFSNLVLSKAHENSPPANEVKFTAKELAFPPADLKQALGQQLLLHKTAQTALRQIKQINAAQTGVYIGMGTDSEIGRLGLRLRLRELINPEISDEQWLTQAEDAISGALTAAGVVGKMPNIPANRLNNQFDFQGPGFTVSREELSGDTALTLAIQAINRGEITTAIVGAVDLSRESVHQAALEQCLSDEKSNQKLHDFKDQTFAAKPADAAVIFILKDLQSAKKDGDTILAVLDETDRDGDMGNTNQFLNQTLGHAHAASGLLHHAAAINMLQSRQTVSETTQNKPLLPRGDSTRSNSVSITVHNKTFGHETSQMTYWSGDTRAVESQLEIKTYAAHSKDDLIQHLQNNRLSQKGTCRCAIVAFKHEQIQKREQAIALLKNGTISDSWNKNGIFYRETPLDGDMAFAFTGAASAYPNMGRDLFNGLPMLSGALQQRLKRVDEAIGWAYEENDPRGKQPFYQLAGSSVICQVHSIISRDYLDLKPQAALGMSSGETNAMFAFNAWSNIDSLFNDIKDSHLYNQALGGDFQTVQQHWQSNGPVKWDNWRLLAPVSEVKKLIASEDKVYLTIINTDSDCVIGGDPTSCKKVLDHFKDSQVLPLGHDIAVHCAAVEPFKERWHTIHSRPTTQPADIRFYSNYFGKSYKLSKASVAEALTGQAVETIDFPEIIRQAWQDGIRIFVEHGPRNSLCSAINQILADKPHCAIPMDRMGVNSFIQVHHAAAELWCAGVPVNLEGLAEATSSHHNEHYKDHASEPSISFLLRPEIRAIEPPTIPAPMHIDLYIPPEHHAGPEHGQFMAPAPPLARTTQLSSTASSGHHLPKVVKKPIPPVMDHKASEHVSTSSEPKTQPFNLTQKPRLEPSRQAKPRISNQAQSHQNPLDLIVAAHAKMTEAHQHYQNRQKEAFQQYTALMQKMQQTLVSGHQNTDNQQSIAAPVYVPVAPGQDQTRHTEPTATPEPVVELVKNDNLPALTDTQRPGPKFSRKQLITLSRGKVSSVLGSLFEKQDDYAIQVRMPEPPLLLCDRVLGIEGEPGQLGTGTIWTETDVLEDSWYLHHGHMPSGIFIEAGQADLLLISWLGIDFINRGERAYRLLGCELVFHGDLPKPGDTLSYEIKVDGHAKQGDVRLFFFHYDCHINGKKRISVRHGQAGFFSIEELEHSAGVLWQADQAEYTETPSLPTHPVLSSETAFTKEQVTAYTEGDLVTCFGAPFYLANTHTRTPRSPGGKYNFIGEVTAFEPTGGPAGRGYLRAESPVHPSDWFFDGHFNNDPCMPGTLMADACLQMMAFYLTATGRTLQRDGWRFQPVQDTKFLFVCRGQVLPESKHLTYEVFVDEIIDGDEPILFAHVLCSVDGRKAFLCERFGLQLVPDWPINDLVDWSKQKHDHRPLANIDGFPLDQRSLLSCAWGQPSHAFGKGFKHFDGSKRAPRLPGPPYHFMTRITSLTGVMGAMATDSSITVLYDIPPDAWYFSENATATMPFCVLMELALQPCGWLSSYSLSPEASQNELLFRNLDGTLVQHREILPADGTIQTHVELLSLSKAGEMIILSFKVVCTIKDEKVAEMDTVFGFFPPQAMLNQKGLSISEHDRAMHDMESNFLVDLTPMKGKYFNQDQLKLPSSKLLMLDRITGYWPDGGINKLGAIHAEKSIHAEEWFFKAHFFQDPVQPGSLGIEAILQLIQTLMLENNAFEDIENPRFEPINLDGKIEWHYRGQVIPKNKKVTIVFEVSEWGTSQKGPFVIGEAAYYVDGLKIYHAPEIGMRIVSSKDLTPHIESIDWQTMRHYWIAKNQDHHRFIHDLSSGLIRSYMDQIIFENLADFKIHRGKPVLFLANHETSVESFLFLTLMGKMAKTNIKAIAKKEHQDSWIGLVNQITQTTLDPTSGVGILFFNRDKPAQLPGILKQYAVENRERPSSLLIHTDGTRATHAGQLVKQISTVFLDSAIVNDLPIIPVCFTGALPQQPTELRLDCPYGSNRQHVIIGKAITPESLEVCPFQERSGFVLERLNQLITKHAKPAIGTPPEQLPCLTQEFRAILEALPDTCEETKELLSLTDKSDLDKLNQQCFQLLN